MGRHGYAVILLAALSFAIVGCTSDEYRVAAASTADGSVLAALHLSPVGVKYQAPCIVALRKVPPARPLSCIYVQTSTGMYFLRFRPGESKYEPAVSLQFTDLTGIALARFGFNRQIQVEKGDEMFAFHIVGAELVNGRMTTDIFQSLSDAGIPRKAPQHWINLLNPVGVTIMIPVYRGR